MSLGKCVILILESFSSSNYNNFFPLLRNNAPPKVCYFSSWRHYQDGSSVKMIFDILNFLRDFLFDFRWLKCDYPKLKLDGEHDWLWIWYSIELWGFYDSNMIRLFKDLYRLIRKNVGKKSLGKNGHDRRNAQSSMHTQ